MKLATWNLQWLNAHPAMGRLPRNQRDYRRLKTVAKRLAADVIAVQEVQGVMALERVFERLEYQLFVSSRGGQLRTGFAVRRGINVVSHAEFSALDVGGLRSGTDITVHPGGRALRLLSIHLKSGCFQGPLNAPGRACRKLRAQLPLLESWIDARAREGIDFAILGDFNRRLFSVPNDEFWVEINDGQPAQAVLWSPTAHRSARCWNARYPLFIDHLVFGRSATARIVMGSFEELLYGVADSAISKGLSDHCPLSVVLR